MLLAQNIPVVRDLGAVLQPLVDRIEAYDRLRHQLESQGGLMGDIERLTDLLSTPVTLATDHALQPVALSQPASVRQALSILGLWTVHLEVRARANRMPTYYLCRSRNQLFGDYDIIVEDYYMSSDYPLPDRRLPKLMDLGREVCFVRASDFRDTVLAWAPNAPAETAATAADQTLYSVGQGVLSAAWHEDQRLGITVAEHFSLPRFRWTIELLYLILSGDLCDLRGSLTLRTRRFFADAYPHPPIGALLDALPAAAGASLDELPRIAWKRYRQLGASFTRFLKHEVIWGTRKVRVPIYKILFANLARAGHVAALLREQASVVKAAGALEAQAEAMGDELLGDHLR